MRKKITFKSKARLNSAIRRLKRDSKKLKRALKAKALKINFK